MVVTVFEPIEAPAFACPPETFLPAEDATPEELHRQFLDQAALANWNTYRLMALIRRMDACEGYERYGCATLANYLELTCGITPAAARERIRVAFALTDLPAIDAAFASGELSYSKVRALSRVSTADNEAEWLDAAREHTAEQLEIMVARSQRGDPMRRRLLTRPLNKHTTRMMVDLPVEEMELVVRALDRIRREVGSQLSASEALVHMAAESLTHDPKPVSTAERYTVVVHTDPNGKAWAESQKGPAPLRPQVVERLLCDCSLRLAKEQEDGSFVLSRRQRTVPLVTRRAVEMRDGQECRVPGCHRRIWSELHHIVPWSEAGRHTRRNLLLLCTRHHTLVHDGWLTIERVENDEVRFRTRDGWVLGEGSEFEEEGVWKWLHEREQMAEVEALNSEEPFAAGRDAEAGRSTFFRSRRPRWQVHERGNGYSPRSNVSAETSRGSDDREALDAVRFSCPSEPAVAQAIDPLWRRGCSLAHGQRRAEPCPAPRAPGRSGRSSLALAPP